MREIYRMDPHFSTGTQAMELNDYLRVIRTRWVWIILATVIGAAVSLGITSMMAPVYKSKASLFIQVESPGDTSYARSQFALQRVGSYPQLINDPLLINQVVGELDQELDFQTVKSSLSAANPSETVLVSVTGQAADPRQAADLANVAASVLATNIEKLENVNPKELTVTAQLSVRATPPIDTISPRKSLNLALGLVTGLSFGLLLAILVDRIDPRILRVKDTERIIKLPVLGDVCREQGHGQHGNRRKANGYRQLISNVLLANDGHLPQRILVLSANKNSEFDAEQFATALASMGKKAVVIYGDEQEFAQRDDVLSEFGVTEVLTGQASLNAAVQVRHEIPMGVLPAGAKQPSLRKFDVVSQLESLISELEASYDVVIVMTTMNTEPIDGAAVALHCDCVLVTAKLKKTTYGKLKAVIEDLSAVRAGATGLVMTRHTAGGLRWLNR
ncbi:Wzz/FepE/Etk N-terminal domain-containing protein [Glutamicibacter sp. AOP3-A1-12]|uniref:Wzz/FepE/Etk N-terminal domain-containing protein n=1 Tax=Glutamicibacter sp. AOP3-A1-12 TaxID=3457701 RepID=UPI0040348A76